MELSHRQLKLRATPVKAVKLTVPVSRYGEGDDVVFRSVVAADVVWIECQHLRFVLAQVDEEARVDEDDAVAALLLAVADRLVLVRPAVVVVEAHSAPIVGVHAQ